MYISNMQLIEIGVDIEETKRFSELKPTSSFTKMIFTKSEIDYCFRQTDYWTHLAARFTAKEAVKKAVSTFNIKNISMKDIEVKLRSDGKPEIKINNPGFKKYKISLSMSHTHDIAISFVVAYKTSTR